MQLSTFDVYVSTVGGIRVTEPGADLAIALAIASAFKNKALPATTAAIGEISLAGEIRAASSTKQRIAEAKRLGFSTVLDAQAEHLHAALTLAFAGAAADPVDVPEF
jgi:DNA repair protein RadA/Sms